jgi:hypothetical protein
LKAKELARIFELQERIKSAQAVENRGVDGMLEKGDLAEVEGELCLGRLKGGKKRGMAGQS